MPVPYITQTKHNAIIPISPNVFSLLEKNANRMIVNNDNKITVKFRFPNKSEFLS